MMNMKLLAVLTPPSIYNGCSAWKPLWEEKFTGEETFFSALNMENCGSHNVRKHREIQGSYKYVTLDILLKFDSLYKMKITYSESEENLKDQERGGLTFYVSRPK